MITESPPELSLSDQSDHRVAIATAEEVIKNTHVVCVRGALGSACCKGEVLLTEYVYLRVVSDCYSRFVIHI